MRSDPWDPMGSTGYRRPRVCTYAHACMRGLWHGAQLGGPIPLTRSQHPSLAIIPLGGFLAKDLIKYCYTRNLIPLRTPSLLPFLSLSSALSRSPSQAHPSVSVCPPVVQDASDARNARSVAPPVRSSWERVASRTPLPHPSPTKSRRLRRYLSRAWVLYLRGVSFGLFARVDTEDAFLFELRGEIIIWK